MSKKSKPVKIVTLQKMPDGSFHILGLGQGGQVTLKKEMRAWRSVWDKGTGRHSYMSWDREEAEAYSRAHELPILEPTHS